MRRPTRTSSVLTSELSRSGGFVEEDLVVGALSHRRVTGEVGLIRFRGRFPKGGYDVPDGNRCNQHPATATTVHG